MTMIFRISALLVLLFLAFGVSAAPGVVPLQIAVQQQVKRDVWVPPILSPHSGTIWHIGKTATVTWYVGFFAHKTSVWRELDPLTLTCRNTSTRPTEVTNPTGTVLLGYLLSSGEGGENLDVGQSSRACSFFCYVVIYVMLVRFRSSPCTRLPSGRRGG
jgi:hypothetical protein